MGGEALKSRVFLTLTCLPPLLTWKVAPLLLAVVLPDTCPQQILTSSPGQAGQTPLVNYKAFFFSFFLFCCAQFQSTMSTAVSIQ